MDPARDSAAPGATGAQDNDQAQKHSKPPGLTAQQFDELLEWALRYAAAGLAVFPCGADKRPLTEHGFLDATTNPDVIRAWWRRLPGALIGVAIPAGYVVVDVDGAEGWAALEAEFGDESAELDAIRPDVLRRLVSNAIEPLANRSEIERLRLVEHEEQLTLVDRMRGMR